MLAAASIQQEEVFRMGCLAGRKGARVWKRINQQCSSTVMHKQMIFSQNSKLARQSSYQCPLLQALSETAGSTLALAQAAIRRQWDEAA